MKINIFFVIFFYCHFILGESNTINEVETRDIGVQTDSQDPPQNETEPVDLEPNTFPSDIIELSLLNLLKMVQKTEYFASISIDGFIQKYTNYEIELYDKFPRIFSSMYQHEVSIDELKTLELIKIYDLELSLNVLKYFGKYIRKLKVDYFLIAPENVEAISSSIAEYCSDSLIQMNLLQLEENTLVNLTKPFTKVEIVTFQIDSNELGAGTPQLCQLFPALRHLTMTARWRLDGDFIDCELPQLEYLSVKLGYGNNEEKIIDFLVKNRQIRNMELYGVSKNFLRKAKDLMLNVETITLGDLVGFKRKSVLPKFWDGIKFRNVKMLTAQQPLTDLSFPSLEELHMDYSVDYVNKWNNFFKIHKNLKKLVITKSRNYGERIELMKLMKHLNELTDVSIECDLKFNIEDIVDFIESQKKLNTFKWTKSTKEDRKILRWKFTHEWKISEYEKGLAFERKSEDEKLEGERSHEQSEIIEDMIDDDDDDDLNEEISK